MAGQETQIGRGAKVAVVDDERFMAEVAADIAEEAELVPIIFSDGGGPFREVAQLLERIRKRGCVAVVCDHRLSGTPFASFPGAELMASLYDEHIPGLLLSTFAGVDSDSTIRRYKELPGTSVVPALLRFLLTARKPTFLLVPRTSTSSLSMCLPPCVNSDNHGS